MELGKGEALVSFLEGNGTPSMVERCMVRPPSARIGRSRRRSARRSWPSSPVKGKYDQTVDSESAYEVLQKRAAQTGSTAPPPPGTTGAPARRGASSTGGFGGFMAASASCGGIFGTSRARGNALSTGQAVAREVTRSVTNRVAGQIAADIGKSLGGKTGSSIGRAIVRGTMGGILRR